MFYEIIGGAAHTKTDTICNASNPQSKIAFTVLPSDPDSSQEIQNNKN